MRLFVTFAGREVHGDVAGEDDHAKQLEEDGARPHGEDG